MKLATAVEGKAALFKQFGGADAPPVVLDTQDTDLIVEIVRGRVHVLAQRQPPAISNSSATDEGSQRISSQTHSMFQTAKSSRTARQRIGYPQLSVGAVPRAGFSGVGGRGGAGEAMSVAIDVF